MSPRDEILLWRTFYLTFMPPCLSTPYAYKVDHAPPNLSTPMLIALILIPPPHHNIFSLCNYIFSVGVATIVLQCMSHGPMIVFDYTFVDDTTENKVTLHSLEKHNRVK